jgi:hypothetical protein
MRQFYEAYRDDEKVSPLLRQFERTVLSPAKVSPLVSQMHPDALSIFKDSYLVEFLGLPDCVVASQVARVLFAECAQ